MHFWKLHFFKVRIVLVKCFLWLQGSMAWIKNPFFNRANQTRMQVQLAMLETINSGMTDCETPVSQAGTKLHHVIIVLCFIFWKEGRYSFMAGVLPKLQLVCTQLLVSESRLTSRHSLLPRLAGKKLFIWATATGMSSHHPLLPIW